MTNPYSIGGTAVASDGDLSAESTRAQAAEGSAAVSLSTLGGSLTGLGSTLSSHSTSISSLGTSLSSVSTSLTGLGSAVTGQSGSISSLGTSLSSVSTSLSGLGSTLTSHSASISSLGTSLSSVSTSLTGLGSTVTGQSGSISSLGTSLSSVGANLSSLGTKVAGLVPGGAALLSSNASGTLVGLALGANLALSGGTLSAATSGTLSLPSAAPLLATSASGSAMPVLLGANLQIAGGTLSASGTVTGVASSSVVTATAANSALTLGDLAARVVQPEDFGAKGDGATDDTAAFQAAINALQGTGRTLRLGAKTYNIAGGLTVSGSMTLRGEGQYNNYDTSGSWMIHGSTSKPLFTVTSAAANMVRFENLAFYEAHPAPPASGTWAPTVYPPVFDVENTAEGVSFCNVLFSPVYYAIKFIGGGRLHVEDMNGQIFRQAIYIDNSQDHNHIRRVHLWPFWSAATPVLAWQQANYYGITTARCDGLDCSDIFIIHAFAAFYSTASQYGITKKLYIVSAYVDLSTYGLLQDGSYGSTQIGCLTTNHGSATTGAPLAGSQAIRVAPTGPSTFNADGSVASTATVEGVLIQAGVLRSESTESNAVECGGAYNRIDLFSLHCYQWNTKNNNSPMILVDNATNGPPNQVCLGSPPYGFPGYYNTNNAPLVNTTGNGIVYVGGTQLTGAYPKGGLPSAVAMAGTQILVSGYTTTGVGPYAYSDGTNWRFVSNGAVVA